MALGVSLLCLPHASSYVLEAFFRYMFSQKSVPCGPLLTKLFQDAILQQYAEFFSFCSRTEQTISTTHWLILGDVMFCLGGPHDPLHVLPSLTHIAPLCSWR